MEKVATDQNKRDGTCPRLTLLFEQSGPADLEKLRDAFSERRQGSEIVISGPGGTGPPLVTDLGIGSARIHFDDFVIELAVEVRAPAPGIEGMIRATNRPNEEFAALATHRAHLFCFFRSGPEHPAERLAACLDVAAACTYQGLIGVIHTDSWQCLLPEWIEEISNGLKEATDDDLSAYLSTINIIPFGSDLVDYYATRGNHLWGLPEFVIPLPQKSRRDSRRLISAVFTYMRENDLVIGPNERVDTPDGPLSTHPIAALGKYESHIASEFPSVVFLTPTIASKLGVETPKDDLTSVIVLALVQTFAAVAEADGTVDERELKSFQKSVRKNFGPGSDFEAVGQAMEGNFSRLLRECLQMGGHPVAAISAFADAANDRLEPEAAAAARRLVYLVGCEIADASGGLFSLGSRISKSEDRALDQLALWLGFELKD